MDIKWVVMFGMKHCLVVFDLALERLLPCNVQLQA